MSFVALFSLTVCIGFSMVAAAEDASSMMCDGGVFEKGDFSQTVQDKCGEPDKNGGKLWRYNFGPSQPVYMVGFHDNGNVVRIIEDQQDN